MMATVIGFLCGKVGVAFATVFSAVTLALSVKAFLCIFAVVCFTLTLHFSVFSGHCLQFLSRRHLPVQSGFLLT